MEDRIRELESERDHWRGIALYLAECHAATLESLPKSASKSTYKRLSAICAWAARELPGLFVTDYSRIQQSLNRSDQILERLIRAVKAEK